MYFEWLFDLGLFAITDKLRLIFFFMRNLLGKDSTAEFELYDCEISDIGRFLCSFLDIE